MRSVSISVVKNEADIIEAMVRHNCQFIDHMTLIDNGSVDGTWEILQALEAEGLPLSIRQDARPGHRQVDFVNSFVSGPECDRSAYVFFLDGDEFIASTREGFDAYLAGRPGNFKMLWKTYVPTKTDNPADRNVLTRIRNRRRREPSKARDHKAVLSPAHTGKVEIASGSHSILKSPMAGQEEIRLAHFPIRSAEQLASKALLGSWSIRLRGRQKTESFQWFDLADRIRKEGLPDAVQLEAYANAYAADRSFRLVTDPLVSPTPVELRHSGLSKSSLLSAMIQFTDFLVGELEAKSHDPGGPKG